MTNKDSGPKKILIVDDNEFHGDMISSILTQHGYSTQYVNNAEEALEILETQPVDLLITDYHMPDTDGVELIYKFRTGEKKKKIPTIIISGFLNELSIPPYGDIVYLPKPVFKTDLLKNVESSLLRNEKSNEQLNHDFLSIFASTTQKVMDFFKVKIESVSEPKKLEENEEIIGDVSAVLNLDGVSFQGKLCFAFGENCYKNLLSKMLMMEIDEIGEDFLDGVGEFANIIYGNSAHEEKIKEFKFKFPLPRVVRDFTYRVSSKKGSKGQRVEFVTDAGRFYLILFEEPRFSLFS